MSFFDLSEDRILRILNGHKVKIPLSQAFKLAEVLYRASQDYATEEARKSFLDGEAIGRSEAGAKEFNSGFEAGKMSKVVSTQRATQREESELVCIASIWANGQFSYRDLESKIKSIKRLREQFPALTLIQAKAIIENVSGMGVGVRW